jgi:hypothetical protein
MPGFEVNIRMPKAAKMLAFLESIEGVEQPAQSGPLIEVQVRHFTASGADDALIDLKPTKRLVELVTASLAGEIERRIA